MQRGGWCVGAREAGGRVSSGGEGNASSLTHDARSVCERLSSRTARAAR